VSEVRGRWERARGRSREPDRLDDLLGGSIVSEITELLELPRRAPAPSPCPLRRNPPVDALAAAVALSPDAACGLVRRVTGERPIDARGAALAMRGEVVTAEFVFAVAGAEVEEATKPRPKPTALRAGE